MASSTLCMTTLYGFRALELVSADICRPWDAERKGLSIGEAAAFALLERAAQMIRAPQRPLIVAGGGVIYGEATDALAQFAVESRPASKKPESLHRAHQRTDQTDHDVSSPHK